MDGPPANEPEPPSGAVVPRQRRVADADAEFEDEELARLAASGAQDALRDAAMGAAGLGAQQMGAAAVRLARGGGAGAYADAGVVVRAGASDPAMQSWFASGDGQDTYAGSSGPGMGDYPSFDDDGLGADALGSGDEDDEEEGPIPRDETLPRDSVDDDVGDWLASIGCYHCADEFARAGFATMRRIRSLTRRHLEIIGIPDTDAPAILLAVRSLQEQHENKVEARRRKRAGLGAPLRPRMSADVYPAHN